jgi:SAM-dependent methyltransferase
MMDRVTETEKGMSVAQSGIERGLQMVRFLERELGHLQSKAVLDAGCGLGGISAAIARSCDYVISMDSDIPRRLRVCSKRFQERGIKNALALSANCLQLPFKPKSFDLILLNGVLEWLGESDLSRPPRDVQRQVLQNMSELLKPGGVLYLAIENRYYPANLLIDPHAKLPIIDFLPRRLADTLSRLLAGRPYRTYIYSYRQLVRLLDESSFHDRRFYTPFTNYMFPYDIVPIEDGRGMIRALKNFPSGRLSSEYLAEVRGRTGRAKFAYFYLIATLRCLRLLSHSFVVLCRQSRGGATRSR